MELMAVVAGAHRVYAEGGGMRRAVMARENGEGGFE
jgi:hypothetical protein